MDTVPAAPPAAVFLPSERVEPGDEQARLVLRLVNGTVLVLPAYSSLDELVRCCGPDQPWVAMRTDDVDALTADLGAGMVLLDTAFTDEPAP